MAIIIFGRRFPVSVTGPNGAERKAGKSRYAPARARACRPECLDPRADEPPDRRLLGNGRGDPAALRPLLPARLAGNVRRRRWTPTGRGLAGQARGGVVYRSLAAAQVSGCRRLSRLRGVEVRPVGRGRRGLGTDGARRPRPRRQGHPHRATRRDHFSERAARRARVRIRHSSRPRHDRRDARPVAGVSGAALDRRRLRRRLRHQSGAGAGRRRRARVVRGHHCDRRGRACRAARACVALVVAAGS